MANVGEGGAWQGDDTITTIDLLRHGEPVGGSKYRGKLDDPLSELGWQQMRATVGDAKPWDLIVSSPLLRCARFAQELGSRHDIPWGLEPEFQEVDFGSWEGLRSADIKAKDPQALMRFWTDPVNHAPEGCEGFEVFAQRIESAWQRLVDSHGNQHVLLVCHGGVIRTIVRHVLGMPLQQLFRIQVPYAGLTRIQVLGRGEQAMASLLFHARLNAD